MEDDFDDLSKRRDLTLALDKVTKTLSAGSMSDPLAMMQPAFATSPSPAAMFSDLLGVTSPTFATSASASQATTMFSDLLGKTPSSFATSASPVTMFSDLLGSTPSTLATSASQATTMFSDLPGSTPSAFATSTSPATMFLDLLGKTPSTFATSASQSVTMFSELLGSTLPTFATSASPATMFSDLLGATPPTFATLAPSANLFSNELGSTQVNLDRGLPFTSQLFSVPAIANRRRRFEILLPLQFNNGKKVPSVMIEEARAEIVDEFGGVSCETAEIEGYWRSGKRIVRDNLIRLWVDVADLEANRWWMKRFKERWKRRLNQDDLWLIDYEIELN